MAVGISLNCYIPKESLAKFNRAVDDYQKRIGRSDKAMLRSSTIDFIKSVRKLTTISKKFVPRSDIRKGDELPKYITGSKGKHKGELLRRMVVKRWRKGGQVDVVAWVPAQSKYVRRMGMRYGNYQGIVKKVQDKASLVNLARARKGKIEKQGLAKKSWGWFMQAFFNKSIESEATDNPNLKIERGRMVDCAHNETYYAGRKGKSYLAAESYTLINKLNYIREAMPMGGFNDAMRAATKGLVYKMQNALRSSRFGNS